MATATNEEKNESSATTQQEKEENKAELSLVDFCAQLEDYTPTVSYLWYSLCPQ